MPNRTDMDTNIKIGQMLRKARENGGITQKDMADAVDISKNHISAIERGVNKAPVAMLLGYCNALNVTPNDVLGFSERNILPELADILSQIDMDKQRKLCDLIEILRL